MPVNPLPKSQEELVRWLLVDVDKGPHVIFAINRMDEVADLEDECRLWAPRTGEATDLAEDTATIFAAGPASPPWLPSQADPYGAGA